MKDRGAAQNIYSADRDAVSDAVAKATVAADYKQHSDQPSTTTKYRGSSECVVVPLFALCAGVSVPANPASRPRFPG